MPPYTGGRSGDHARYGHGVGGAFRATLLTAAAAPVLAFRGAFLMPRRAAHDGAR